MMKNKKMGILAVLVMLVAVTLNAVGGTYAKYISAYDMTDEARVAKWDFRNEATNTVDLFQSSYTKDGYSYVASSDASKVVAPGTEGEYSYKITGTAETNYKATKTVKVLNRIAIVGDYYFEQLGLGNWGTKEGEYEKGQIYYNPIEFSIDGGATWKKAEKFEYDEKTGKFAGLSIEFDVEDDVIYPANYVLTDELEGTIKWRWKFQTGETENEKFANDALDTNLARLVDVADLTMEATVGVVVIQTQEKATVAAKADDTVNVNASRYVVFGNKAPESYLVQAQKEVGYDPVNSQDVVFTGNAIRGTIYNTVNSVADRFQGTNNTGYYYPITVSAYAEENTTITSLHIKSTRYDQDITNGWGNILALTEADKENGIVVTVTYSDNTTKNFTLDMSELTFATTTNQSNK